MRLVVDRLNLLQEYGLNEHQARVYLALVEFPALPAGALAKAASVPRNRLYEVLEELQGLGLVDIILGETRQYRARPLSTYLDRSVSGLRQRIEQIEAQRAYLDRAFQPPALVNQDDLDSGATRVLLTRRAVAREIDRMGETAKRSLVAVGSDGGWERVVHHLAAVAEKRPELLEIHLPRTAALTGGAERLGEKAFAAVRWTSVPLRTLSFVADERELLLVHGIPDDGKPRAGRDYALLTTNPAFVRDHLALVRAAQESGPRKGDG